VRLVAGTLNQNGTITGVAPTTDAVTTSVTASINGNSTLTQSLYGGTSTLTVGSITNITQLLAVLGSDRPPITLSGTGTFTFDQAYSPTQGYLDLTVNSGQTVVMNVAPRTLRNVTLDSGGTLTGPAFAFYKNTASGSANAGATPTWPVFATDPTATGCGDTRLNGNGRLVLSLSGTLTNNGTITMAGKGYPGGGYGPGQSAVGKSNGWSPDGYGAGGAGLSDNGGGSYGTSGGGTTAGTTYGASDFWTKLYLGSGGASYNAAGGPTCTSNCSWNGGGYGGGAISICAAAISNAGSITSAGTKPSLGGGGSGGTINLYADGTIDNSGTVSTAGGTFGSSTNSGGNGRVKLSGSSVSNTGAVIGTQ
jgi:hypothetical protein